MGSLAPYSIGTCLPYLQPQKCNYSAPLSYTIRAVQVQQQVDERQLKRRDALGLAFSTGLVHGLWQTGVASAAEIPCEFQVAPSGLAFCDKLVGTGPQAVKGQLIKAHYVGRLENGKVFDSSYNRGKPLTFRVGVGEVIKGWDEGILGGDGVPPMLAGGKRTLKLPPELGYGSRGAGCRGGSCVIPPDSVLLFDVEFVSKA
ncbi:peptidyl-prolyl cis-trans isomerase FKBP13, chloroplastic [Abrus precatorius]|uniref:peptidylprolyl isomerase n=1 Tax=Abrus precatorius TaxID=3816 RepID=A0A8B8KSM4_ABRPR|nr:peptidyl-prolyl cis-trans isomerase FKBP13, chloroplastic [Abrus precatorius]